MFDSIRSLKGQKRQLKRDIRALDDDESQSSLQCYILLCNPFRLHVTHEATDCPLLHTTLS